ncbi:MAG: hypothetical protein DWH91_06585 [Planctomycetota bacterium]|nr:MAG: hypothetical protein DWH91_06585 [Planctomycetota bacterium]
MVPAMLEPMETNARERTPCGSIPQNRNNRSGFLFGVFGLCLCCRWQRFDLCAYCTTWLLPHIDRSVKQ